MDCWSFEYKCLCSIIRIDWMIYCQLGLSLICYAIMLIKVHHHSSLSLPLESMFICIEDKLNCCLHELCCSILLWDLFVVSLLLFLVRVENISVEGWSLIQEIVVRGWYYRSCLDLLQDWVRRQDVDTKKVLWNIRFNWVNQNHIFSWYYFLNVLQWFFEELFIRFVDIYF